MVHSTSCSAPSDPPSRSLREVAGREGRCYHTRKRKVPSFAEDNVWICTIPREKESTFPTAIPQDSAQGSAHQHPVEPTPDVPDLFLPHSL